MTRQSRLAAAAFAAVIMSAGSAFAQTVAVGALECRGGGSTGFIVGSVRNYECVYLPSNGRPPQFYWGRVTKIGVDLGFTNETALLWNVFAPTDAFGPGALDGSYGGVSAGVSVGVGVGANALVGSANSFVLQPVSLEGQSGVAVSAGVASFELGFIPDRRPTWQPRVRPPVR